MSLVADIILFLFWSAAKRFFQHPQGLPPPAADETNPKAVMPALAKSKKKKTKKKKKKKSKKGVAVLPSAAALLNDIPDSILGKGAAVFAEDLETGPPDDSGVKYNAAPPPSGLHEVDEEAAWRLRPVNLNKKPAQAARESLRK